MFENIAVTHIPKFSENSKSTGPGSSVNPERRKQHKHKHTDNEKCLQRRIAIRLLRSSTEEASAEQPVTHRDAEERTAAGLTHAA